VNRNVLQHYLLLQSTQDMDEPIEQQTSQDGVESNNVTKHQRSSSKNKEERSNTKHKKKKKSSSRNRKPKPPPKDKGTTVSKFMKKQQTLQNESTYQYTKRNNQMIQQGQIVSEDHYYFDTDSDNDYDEKKNGALVPHSQQQQSSQQSNKIVDTLPADHPSSSTIQTHRTCTICQRTLPRSQFSERDRYTINYSLSPPGGVTCRTCTLTICAVKLKSIPSTEELLLEYAQKGVRDGLLALEQQQQQLGGVGRGNVAGYLEGSQQGMHNALVLRKNSQVSGNELMLYGGGRHTPPSPMDSTTGMMPPNHSTRNINAPFSGRQYAHTDIDRPSSNIAPSKYIDTLLQLPCYLNLNAYGIYKNCEEISISMSVLECVRLYGTLKQDYFREHDCDGLLVTDGNEAKKDTPTTVAAVNPKSIVCIVLGEGSTPRTAILASQHYGWTTIAVDPSLSSDWEGYHEDIPNFTGYNTSISDFMSNDLSTDQVEFIHRIEHLVIICIQHTKDSVRLKGTAHINEIRERYNDVPTTLVSISPIRKVTLAPTNRRNGQCGSKLEKDVGYEPNCSYIDENVFSEVRQVEVWNFHNANDDDVDIGTDEEEYNVSEELGRDKADDTVRPLVVNVDERKKPIKKNTWLEDKVAQHKKSQQGHVEARERGETMAEQQQEEEVFAGDASAQSLGTLSTKETLERRVSCDMVDKPGGVSSKASPTMEGIDERTNEQQPNVVDGVWSHPPNEEEATNDVWEKAMKKHSQQEEEESNNQSDEEYEEDDEEQNEQDWKANQGLPPNWEAIFDPSSGEYYYNNWDTNEVTWDRPAPLEAQGLSDQGNQVPMSPLDDQGVEDHQPEDNIQPVNQEVDDDQGAAGNNTKNQPMDSQSDFYQSDTSNYVFGHDDDQSSTSSGIAGLTACAVPPALGNSADEDDEDNHLAWSDNEEEKDQFDDSPRTSLQRTESTTSQKSKPWHKKDSTSVNNDSFISY